MTARPALFAELDQAIARIQVLLGEMERNFENGTDIDPDTELELRETLTDLSPRVMGALKRFGHADQARDLKRDWDSHSPGERFRPHYHPIDAGGFVDCHAYNLLRRAIEVLKDAQEHRVAEQNHELRAKAAQGSGTMSNDEKDEGKKDDGKKDEGKKDDGRATAEAQDSLTWPALVWRLLRSGYTWLILGGALIVLYIAIRVLGYTVQSLVVKAFGPPPALIPALTQNTIRHYYAYVTVTGKSTDCRQDKCRLTYYAGGRVESPPGQAIKYEDILTTGGRIVSFRTEPYHVILNQDQYEKSRRILKFRIDPVNSQDERLLVDAVAEIEKSITETDGQIGLHMPYVTDNAVMIVDFTGVDFQPRNMQPRTMEYLQDGREQPGRTQPRMHIEASGKIVVLTADNLKENSSLMLVWGTK